MCFMAILLLFRSSNFKVHSVHTFYRTNLPKEVMGFPDFPVPEQDKSYLTQQEIWDFLHLYADHYNLKPLIRVIFITICTLTKLI